MKLELTKSETGTLARVIFNEIATMHEIGAQGSIEWDTAKKVINFILEAEEITISDNLPF